VHEWYVCVLGLLCRHVLQASSAMLGDLPQHMRNSRARSEMQQLRWHVRVLCSKVQQPIWWPGARHSQSFEDLESTLLQQNATATQPSSEWKAMHRKQKKSKKSHSHHREVYQKSFKHGTQLLSTGHHRRSAHHHAEVSATRIPENLQSVF